MFHIIMHLINGGNPPRNIHAPVPAHLHHLHPIITWLLKSGR